MSELDSIQISRARLAEAFSVSAMTVNRRVKGVKPAYRKGKTDFYHLCDVTELIDVRKVEEEPDDEEENVSDPDKMPPDKRRLFYQAEDLREAAELKARKNAIEAGRLLEASTVERVVAEAFKTMALTLDTLPDQFERDGIIDSHNINRVIEIVDNARNQLALDLTKVSPPVEEIEAQGDWG